MSDNPTVRTSAKVVAGACALAASVLAGHEGIKFLAYYDPVKIPTICMGHTMNVHMGDVATREQCLKFAGQDVTTAVEQVVRCHPNIEFKDYQLAAFADLVYNIGPTPVCSPKSTLANYLRAGNIAAACSQIPRWDKAKVMGLYTTLSGLTIRRAKNLAMCEGRT